MTEPIQLDRAFGREAFGADPANYNAARADYPAWVWRTLAEACGVGPGSSAFEIGAGTGKATGAVRTEGAYEISRLRPKARRIGGAIRGHWSIEQGLPWLLEGVLREDARRL